VAKQRLHLISRREARLLLVALAALVIIGAVINVPLAVSRFRGLTFNTPRGLTLRQPEIGDRPWPAPTPHATAWPAPTQWDEWRGFGERHYNVFHHSDEARFQMQAELYGFPLPVVENKMMWWDWNDPALKGPESSPPMRLLWRGLILNPILLGGGAFVILLGPVALAIVGWRLVTRLRRRRSDRCVFCGYPVGTNAVCTECGRVIGAGTRIGAM
jgi:hypothetical protein